VREDMMWNDIINEGEDKARAREEISIFTDVTA
jgi:hypothetical protein